METQAGGLGTGFPQRGKEPFPILVILEDGFLPISAVPDRVNRTHILHSQLARHALENAPTDDE
jgi:hypothetical protein